MKIDYELAEKIGVTHYSEVGDFYKIHEGILLCYGIEKKWNQSILSPASIVKCVRPIPPKSQPESDYDRGMRKAMQSIAKSCGKVFGVDIGYDDLPALVESLVNPPKPKPPVRVDHEKVTESPSEIYRAMLDGEKLYRFKTDLMEFDGEQFWIHTNEGKIRITFINEINEVYRRIEKPVDWQNAVVEFMQGHPEDGAQMNQYLVDELNDVGWDNMTDSDFLEMCRVALRATGEL